MMNLPAINPTMPPPLSCLEPLRQIDFDWFAGQGVPMDAITDDNAVYLARGEADEHGYFEPARAGPTWFAIPQERDVIFWKPRSGAIARDTKRCFALGAELIWNPATCALGQSLEIFNSPLEWLRAVRKGLVVFDWPSVFEQLRHVQRITVAEEVLPLYRRHMRTKLPDLAVRPADKKKDAAA